MTGGTVKYLLASAGLGFLYVRRDLVADAAPDADRLVRRRGHLQDGHRRLLPGRRCPPLRCRNAAGAEHLRRRRGPLADRGGRARRRSRRTCASLRRRSSPASTSSARTSSRRAIRPAVARSSASARSTPSALVVALAAEGIVASSRDQQPAHRAPSLQHARGRRGRARGALPPSPSACLVPRSRPAVLTAATGSAAPRRAAEPMQTPPQSAIPGAGGMQPGQRPQRLARSPRAAGRTSRLR